MSEYLNHQTSKVRKETRESLVREGVVDLSERHALSLLKIEHVR